MLSRVADAVYWASRYVERAENVARFVNVNLDLMLESAAGQKPSWEPLVLTTGDSEWFRQHYEALTPESVTQFLTFDRRYPNSILSTVSNARENARTVREVISREMWHELNSLYLTVVEASKKGVGDDDMVQFYERVKVAGIYYAGVTDATLSHGEAWHFSRLGRMIERADKTSRILDVKYFTLLSGSGKGHEGSEESNKAALRSLERGVFGDQIGWTALLNSASALQMFRQEVHHIEPKEVVRFLLQNGEFPRSIRFCVHAAQESLHAITGTPLGSYRDEAERLLGVLRSQLDYTGIDEIIEIGLHEYLDQLQLTFNEIGGHISRRFFQI